MAQYPYISGQAALVATFAQLRKGFPPKVDASYLQRFSIAPANESYVISILRFLGLIGEDGNRVEETTSYFYGNDDSFQSGFESTLRSSYSQLFDEMGDGALTAERGNLAHWFRAWDKTSDLVGQRQASTFQTLAALAGYGALPAARGTVTKKATAASASAIKKTTPTKATAAKTTSKQDAPTPSTVGQEGADAKVRHGREVGLTVRIEVNLPPGGDTDTYDAIFASIKKHLMS